MPTISKQALRTINLVNLIFAVFLSLVVSWFIYGRISINVYEFFFGPSAILRTLDPCP